MQHCNNDMSDFSFFAKSNIRRVPHFYCQKCGTRFFRGKWYTAEEWFFYVNGVIYNKQIHTGVPHAHVHTFKSEPT